MNAVEVHLKVRATERSAFKALPPVPQGSASITRADTGLSVRERVVGLLIGIVFGCLITLFSRELQETVYRVWPALDSNSATLAVPEIDMEASNSEIAARVGRLRAKMTSFVPRSSYLVVSTSDNHFELFRKGKVMRSGVCSTGSYVLLRGGHNQEWMFQTPRGAFRVQEKRTNPVWTKPDWAFIEEGLPVPPPGAPARFERGVLGDYALAIGNGYLIHGTLYQRLLGLPVTHGCVRLGDEDLEILFRELALGNRIFIY